MSRLSHSEVHMVHRIGWLRAAVLGANDGLVSTASLVVGVAAAGSGRTEILIAGLAGLVAGAMSMAAGEYVSVSSQTDAEQADIARETRELKETPEAELDELTRIYVARGLDDGLARLVAIQLTEKDALGSHSRDELGISETVTAHPIQAALVSAGTFAVAIAVPPPVAVIRGLPGPSRSRVSNGGLPVRWVKDGWLLLGLSRNICTTAYYMNTDGLGLRALIGFFVLAFGLSWGVLGLYLLVPAIAETLGPVSNHHPLFILAVYAPAIAAVTLVLWHDGREGLQRFLSRLLLWRVSPGWWGFLLVGVPLVYLAGAAFGGTLLLPDFQGLGALLGAMLFMLVLGPMEEFGWRGFALPLMQRYLAPFGRDW